MADLREKTILTKNPEALSWKSFYALHFKYLLHTTSFHDFVCTYFPFHEQHLFPNKN